MASEENLYTDPSETEPEEEEEEEQREEEEEEAVELEAPPQEICLESIRDEEAGERDGAEADAAGPGGDWDEVSSQVSTASSEDYTVILPDCFDTTRPLGGSMYSSAVSQHGGLGAGVGGSMGGMCVSASEPRLGPSVSEPQLLERARMMDGGSGGGGVGGGGGGDGGFLGGERRGVMHGSYSMHGSVSHMLCASQTLDAPALVPEVVLMAPGSMAPPPVPPRLSQR